MKTFLDLPQLTDKQLQIVNGLLLGDASLHHRKDYPHWNWSLVHTQSKFDKDNVDKFSYMQFIEDFLSPHSSCLSNKIIIDCKANFVLKKRNYYSYVYRTHSHPIWTDLGQKWYAQSENGIFIENEIGRIIKVVPRDLRLTPLTACVWFMDDGFNYPKDGNAFLETQGFSVEDVQFLLARLKDDLDIQAKMRLESRSKLPIIYIGTKSWRDFIELVKPHVQWDCFQYKVSTKEYTKVHNGGESHPLAKLTEEQVKEIFQLYYDGWSQKDIAQKFDTTCVSNILTGKLWRHLGITPKFKSNYMKPHLTKEQKNKVLELRLLGLSQAAIAKQVGINQATVCRVLKTWTK